jgi:hypothetical protein
LHSRHEWGEEDMNVPNEHLAFRPGGVSAFFVYKASFMAIAFWGWFAVLTVRSGTASSWHLMAAACAVTTTLVAVILGVRYVLARTAAARHEQIMHTLVELSWQSFATPPGGVPKPKHEDADVIQLSQESRPRPRR